MKNRSKSGEKNVLTYQNTKLLLEIYREVVWTVEDNLYEVEDIRDEFGSSSISNLVDFLSIDLEDYAGTADKSVIEKKLMNIAQSKSMIEIIDKAMLKLRSHPKNGEIYFNILKDTYIEYEKITDVEIQDKYHLSSSSFYRYKKKAIEILGFIIWGYILPSLRDYGGLDRKVVAEGDEEYDS